MKQALALPAALLLAALSAEAAEKPNIILIYADDLGYGDVGCYGATAVKTPHVDRLATEGLRLTGGYSAAATCTPSRYALMTGEYAFRKKGTGILPGDAAMILPTGRATLPSILRKAGYATGIVGKWHLGLGAGGALIDWNGEIKPGPREAGFAESFIMAATGDRTPCVYIDGGKIAGLSPSDPIAVSYGKPFPGEPTGVSERDRLKMDWSHGHNNAVVNGIGRIGFSRGGKSALWKDEDMADTFTRKGVGFIERHREHPFFLYFATHDIHVPRVPHARFVGTTTASCSPPWIAWNWPPTRWSSSPATTARCSTTATRMTRSGNSAATGPPVRCAAASPRFGKAAPGCPSWSVGPPASNPASAMPS